MKLLTKGKGRERQARDAMRLRKAREVNTRQGKGCYWLRINLYSPRWVYQRGSDPLVQLKCFSITDTHSPHVELHTLIGACLGLFHSPCPALHFDLFLVDSHWLLLRGQIWKCAKRPRYTNLLVGTHWPISVIRAHSQSSTWSFAQPNGHP